MCGKNMPIPRGRKYVVSENNSNKFEAGIGRGENVQFWICHHVFGRCHTSTNMFPTKKWIPASQLITEPSRLDPGRNSSTMVRLRSCRCCLPTLGDSMRFCNMLVTEWYEGVMIAISPWIPNIITDQKAWPRSLVVKSFVVPPPIDLRSAPQLQRAVYLSEIRSLVGLERYQSRWK